MSDPEQPHGELTVRVQMIAPYSWIDSLESTGLAEGFGDEWLRLAALKSFTAPPYW